MDDAIQQVLTSVVHIQSASDYIPGQTQENLRKIHMLRMATNFITSLTNVLTDVRMLTTNPVR